MGQFEDYELFKAHRTTLPRQIHISHAAIANARNQLVSSELPWQASRTYCFPHSYNCNAASVSIVDISTNSWAFFVQATTFKASLPPVLADQSMGFTHICPLPAQFPAHSGSSKKAVSLSRNAKIGPRRATFVLVRQRFACAATLSATPSNR